MTQRNQGMKMSSLGFSSKRKDCNGGSTKIEIMIRGYQEMADINLKISRLCFEVESEADGLYIRPTECD